MFRIFDQYVSRKTVFVVAGDALSIVGSIILGYRIRFWNDAESFAFFTQQPDLTFRSLTILAVFQVCAYYNELYRAQDQLSASDQFFRLTQATGVGCFFLAAIYYAAPQLSIGRSVFAMTLIFLLISTTSLRWLADLAWRTALPKRTILILGTDEVARRVAGEISLRADLNMHVVGFAGASRPDDLLGDYLGDATGIEDLVRKHSVQTVLVSDNVFSGSLPLNALLKLRTRGVRVEDANAALAGFTGKISIETVQSPWFVFSTGFSRSGYAMAFKRLTDLLLSTVGLIVSLPVMLVVALAIRLTSPGPALFRQTRVGLNGRFFDVLKFRTMRQDAEVDGVARWSQEDDPRITSVGRFLRVYRLDELPQFINVIRGQMSFIGPRPERPEFVNQILQVEPLYAERHTLRPGLTGWAQVCYPYGSNLDDAIRKLEYDLFYLKNVSFLFDMAIIFQTVKIVLWGRGR
jgi:sugar transferase (PEP-CTERM system associated)